MTLKTLNFRFAGATALAMLILSSALPAEETPDYDIVVYGDSSGAVTASIDAKRRGLSVILVNPTAFPGGMSASGLGATNFLSRRTTFGGKTYRGKMFIDATYVGDLMAAAGASYTVGREAESQYGEDLAGVRPGR